MQDCLSFKDTVHIRQYGTEYKITKYGNESFHIMFHDNYRKQWHPVDVIFDSLEDCIRYARNWSMLDKFLDMHKISCHNF